MKPLPAEAVHIIVCEDVRHELGNKRSYMGVYGPTIDVVSLPALLPAISVVLLVRNPVALPEQMTFKVTRPDGVTMVDTGPQLAKAEGTKRPFDAEWVVRFAPFRLDVEGPHKFSFTFGVASETFAAETTIVIALKSAP